MSFRGFSSAPGFLGELGNTQPMLPGSVDEVLCSGVRGTSDRSPALAISWTEPAQALDLSLAGACAK